MMEARAAEAGPHGLALALALAVTLAVLAAGAALLHGGRLPPDRSGQVVVLFPPGADRIAVFAAVAAADGLMVRETWLANVVLAEGAAPGFVGRLTDAGAWAAYTPFDLGPAMVGGCTGIALPR